jgi:hypothetical protein
MLRKNKPKKIYKKKEKKSNKIMIEKKIEENDCKEQLNEFSEHYREIVKLRKEEVDKADTTK